MKNPFRIINEKYKDLKLFSIEGVMFLGAIVGLGSLFSYLFHISVKVIGIVYIILAILLIIDSYIKEKQEDKE